MAAKTKTFQCNAMGDSMCFAAENLDEAKAQLTALCGDLPANMVKWQVLDCLPDGEEYAADLRGL